MFFLWILPILLFLSSEVENSQQKSGSEPSLVELARRAKEVRTGKASGGLVITNATIARFRGASVSSSRRIRKIEAVTTPSGKVMDSPKSVSLEQDAAFRHAAFSEAQLNLKNAVYRGMILRLKMNNLRNALLREDDGSTQGLIQSQLQQTFLQIQANRKEVKKAQALLEELEGEARRAGVPRAQIREWIEPLPELEDFLSETTPNP